MSNIVVVGMQSGMEIPYPRSLCACLESLAHEAIKMMTKWCKLCIQKANIRKNSREYMTTCCTSAMWPVQLYFQVDKLPQCFQRQ